MNTEIVGLLVKVAALEEQLAEIREDLDTEVEDRTRDEDRLWTRHEIHHIELRKQDVLELTHVHNRIDGLWEELQAYKRSSDNAVRDAEDRIEEVFDRFDQLVVAIPEVLRCVFPRIGIHDETGIEEAIREVRAIIAAAQEELDR
jgi:hypothetical protein